MNLPNLHDETKADVIFYKKSGDGFLLLLKYTTVEKKHSTVDNSVVEMDNRQMKLNCSASTAFVSVSDVGSGKVRSFIGNDRTRDDLFRQIFNPMLPMVMYADGIKDYYYFVCYGRVWRKYYDDGRRQLCRQRKW